MKEAGTTKNGLLKSKPSISLSYSFKYGSALEYCCNSSEIDSISLKNSFSVISNFISIKNYILFIKSQEKISNLYILGFKIKIIHYKSIEEK